MGLLGRLLGKESGRSKQIRRVLDERGIVEGARVEVVVPNILKNYVGIVSEIDYETGWLVVGDSPAQWYEVRLAEDKELGWIWKFPELAKQQEDGNAQ